MSMVYPILESTGNHAIGASTTTCGLGHSYPGPSDKHVYLLWEWEDCCLPVIIRHRTLPSARYTWQVHPQR